MSDFLAPYPDDCPLDGRLDAIASLVAKDIEETFFRDDWTGGVGQRRAAVTVLVRDAMSRALKEATTPKDFRHACN